MLALLGACAPGRLACEQMNDAQRACYEAAGQVVEGSQVPCERQPGDLAPYFDCITTAYDAAECADPGALPDVALEVNACYAIFEE